MSEATEAKEWQAENVPQGFHEGRRLSDRVRASKAAIIDVLSEALWRLQDGEVDRAVIVLADLRAVLRRGE